MRILPVVAGIALAFQLIFAGDAFAQEGGPPKLTLPVKIYVFTQEPKPGAPVRPGLDNRRDSVNDIIKSLRRRGNREWIEVVDSADQAVATLEVTDRSPITTSRLMSNLSTGYRVVETEFRIGDFEIRIEGADDKPWSTLADRVANTVVLWVKDNYGGQ